jgi:hypothetical protein
MTMRMLLAVMVMTYWKAMMMMMMMMMMLLLLLMMIRDKNVSFAAADAAGVSSFVLS